MIIHSFLRLTFLETESIPSWWTGQICELFVETESITIEKDFSVKIIINHNWRIMGTQPWYLLKGYVRHKSNRKKNCREAAADVRYKSQYQFLCGIQRNISIQVLKQKQKLFSEKRFI